MKKIILTLMLILSSPMVFSSPVDTSFMLALTTKEQISLLKDRLKKDPHDLPAYRDLAKIYIQNEQLATGLQLYFTALALNPDFIDVAFGKEIGPWKERDHLSLGTYPLPVETLWNSEALKEKTLLVYYKKGLGDTIEFSRFLITLLQKNPEKILFVPQKGLESLFRTSFADLPQIEIVDSSVEPTSLHFDYHTSLLRLPHVLNIDIEKINQEPYLKVELVEKNPLLSEENCFKIGLVWNGDSRHIHNPARAIALKKIYETLADLPQIKLFSIQKGDGEEQLADIPPEAVINLGPSINTFEDTARLMKQLDLFVTIDTSSSHLSGALGIPTLLLLCKECDMKWAEPLGRDNLWYESVRTLRQKQQGDWSGPIKKLREAVRVLMEEKGLK